MLHSDQILYNRSSSACIYVLSVSRNETWSPSSSPLFLSSYMTFLFWHSAVMLAPKWLMTLKLSTREGVYWEIKFLPPARWLLGVSSWQRCESSIFDSPRFSSLLSGASGHGHTHCWKRIWLMDQSSWATFLWLIICETCVEQLSVTEMWLLDIIQNLYNSIPNPQQE